MAKQVITKATVLYGEVALQGEARSAELSIEVPTVDTTNLASGGWREFLAGLRQSSVSIEGMFDSSDAEGAMFAGTNRNVLVSKERPVADGDLAYALNTIRTMYTPGWTVGEAQGYQLDFQPASPLIRGNILYTATLTTTTDGAGQELGAISASQAGYGGLHVLSVSGTSPTLDVVIESDAGDTWAGAETSRITFSQETDATAGYQWQTVAGAITDTWWRATATIGGTGTPTFQFVVFFGIGTTA